MDLENLSQSEEESSEDRFLTDQKRCSLEDVCYLESKSFNQAPKRRSITQADNEKRSMTSIYTPESFKEASYEINFGKKKLLTFRKLRSLIKCLLENLCHDTSILPPLANLL